jgi:hypothetical protein
MNSNNLLQIASILKSSSGSNPSKLVPWPGRSMVIFVCLISFEAELP